MTLLSWFGSLFKNPNFTGYVPDNRTAAEKSQDYLHEERVAGTPVEDPFGNPQITASPYFYENQNNTSSCVPHGVGLALAIEHINQLGFYQRLSWIFAYRLRSNYAAEGSIFQNIFEIYRKTGAPLFTTLPDPVEEYQANAVVLTTQEYNEAAIYKGLTYFTLGSSYNDITTIANIGYQGHAVPILIYATEDEYSRQYPEILNNTLTIAQSDIQHCVCVLPNSGFIKDGIKYVAIQDSAWFGGWKLRYLSEQFIKARSFAAGYWTKVAMEGGGTPPKFTFTQTLKFGDKNDEVKQMQLLLISQGFLPSDCATGLFAGFTLAAVNAFQSKYAADILLPQGLMKPTGLWGSGCIKQANILCA